jgi:hypothetical protein
MILFSFLISSSVAVVQVVKLAVAQNPHAVRIWIKAADLEVEQRSKRRVFRKVTLAVLLIRDVYPGS